jgi:uncharacterized zinc-type alcohol dehydrogenase-like protein
LDFLASRWYLILIRNCACRHEIIGKVTKIGSEVSKFEVGDIVGVGCLVNSCRSCESCGKGEENYCPKQVQTYAAEDVDGTLTQGGYSNIMVVNEQYIIKIISQSIPKVFVCMKWQVQQHFQLR